MNRQMDIKMCLRIQIVKMGDFLDWFCRMTDCCDYNHEFFDQKNDYKMIMVDNVPWSS
jgi:hypothetical protein